MEERELIQKSKHGDSDAFEMLITPLMQGIISHAYMMFQNREDAFDMAQETFVKAFIKIGTFNEQSSFKTWIYKILTNVCLDELRKRKRRAQTISLTIDDDDTKQTMLDIEDNSSNPQHNAEKNELRKAIVDAIGELEYEYRTAIILRELEGMNYNEIASTLGISLGTVKSRINRARNQLREKLLKYRELL